MAVFNILTLELVLFIAVMLTYSKLLLTRMLPLNMVKDLVVYLVPT